MRMAVEIKLTEAEREVLNKWAKGQSTPARLVERARIVLLAAAGKENRQIATQLGLSKPTVGLWRKRFAQRRLAGIEKNAPRSGRRPTRMNQQARRILETTRHRHQEWIKFLGRIDPQMPAELDLHVVVDNYATHKHPRGKEWLRRHPHFHLHFIPIGTSNG